MAKSGSIYKQKNSQYFWVKYYQPGNPKPVRESTKTDDKDEAQNFLHRRLGEVATGKFGGLEAERVRVDDLLDLVIEDQEANHRTSVVTTLSHMKHLRKFFGKLKAAQMGTRQIKAYIAKRQKEGAANSTINRELSQLHRAFVLGFEEENPQLVMKPLKVPHLVEDNIREGVVTYEHYGIIRGGLREPYRTFFVCAFHLGTRRGELAKVQWSEVDFKTGLITLKRYNTKTKEPRVLPIYGHMLEYLKMAKEVGDALYPECPWVFQKRGKRFAFSNREWHTQIAKLKMPQYLFHDLRRTGVSCMMDHGFTKEQAKKVSGHKTDAVFFRYRIEKKSEMEAIRVKLEDMAKTRDEEARAQAPGIFSGIAKTDGLLN